MKRLALFWLFLCCLVFCWCGKNLWENKSVYEWELIIVWVWPEISFEPTVEKGTLVLRNGFEDHTDHVFLSRWIWEKYLREESDYLPWNTVRLKWVVKALDWAAGNHYYEVVSIDKLRFLNYPDAASVKDLLKTYSYCESDSDCWYIMWECPLWCYIPLNTKYIDIASNIVSNFVNHLDERCVYGCIVMNKAKCENYKCEMYDAGAEEDVHWCWPLYKDPDFEKKHPELACDDSSYDPVCANDGKTYQNDCYACTSPLVETYTFWKCENSALVVEWDSEYLNEAMNILEKDWAVSCNLFYTNQWRQIHALFMADKNRFYSEKDDYSDNYRKNQVYAMVRDWKTYYWSTFPDSDNIIENSIVDIESEIASILMDTWKYPDFKMDCSGWIENESLFTIAEWKF